MTQGCTQVWSSWVWVQPNLTRSPLVVEQNPVINRKHQQIGSSWIFNKPNQARLKLREGAKIEIPADLHWRSHVLHLIQTKNSSEKGGRVGFWSNFSEELESTLLDLHLPEPPSTIMVIESVEVQVARLLHQSEQMVDSLDMTVVERKIHVELFLIQFLLK